MQWQIQGRGSHGGGEGGGRDPTLFLDQTEGRRAEKKIFDTAPRPPLLSEGLDSPLRCSAKL